MPYNLRKRTKPEEPVAPPPAPKPTVKRKLKASTEDGAVEVEPAKKAKTTKAPKAAPAAKKPRTTASKAPKVEPVIESRSTPEKEPEPDAEVEKNIEEENKIQSDKRDEKLKTGKKVEVEKKPETKSPQEPETKSERLNNQLMFGTDSCGEFGLGRSGFLKKNPVPAPIPKPVRQVACGPMHTLSLTIDGEIYSYGCNDEGALGRETDGDETLESTPAKIDLDHKVKKITAGDSHGSALTEDGLVFVWGNFRDEHGSIGLTPESDAKSTKLIQILPEIKFKDIASGGNHVLLLDDQGNVYSFGCGAQGQLGRLKQEEVGDASNQLTADKRKLCLTPKKVNLKNVDPSRPFICDAIYAGAFTSFATNTDKKKNRLAGWGLNNYHQLGYKGSKGDIVQFFPKRSTFTCSTSMIDVACGQHHTLFLTKSGRLYAAGRHEYGMLGVSHQGEVVCPAKKIDKLTGTIIDISAGINTSFAVDEEGKLYSWGMGGYHLGLQSEEDLKEPAEVINLKSEHVKSVSAGGQVTAVLVV